MQYKSLDFIGERHVEKPEALKGHRGEKIRVDRSRHDDFVVLNKNHTGNVFQKYMFNSLFVIWLLSGLSSLSELSSIMDTDSTIDLLRAM